MNNSLYSLGQTPITTAMFVDAIYQDLQSIRSMTSSGNAQSYDQAFSVAVITNDPYAFDTPERSRFTTMSILGLYTLKMPDPLDEDVICISRYLHQKLRTLHLKVNGIPMKEETC